MKTPRALFKLLSFLLGCPLFSVQPAFADPLPGSDEYLWQLSIPASVVFTQKISVTSDDQEFCAEPRPYCGTECRIHLIYPNHYPTVVIPGTVLEVSDLYLQGDFARIKLGSGPIDYLMCRNPSHFARDLKIDEVQSAFQGAIRFEN